MKFTREIIAYDALHVAPFAGAWIEITFPLFLFRSPLSLPSRERGLKSFSSITGAFSDTVAPFAGAWIEIVFYENIISHNEVAPFAGAWIEIECLSGIR